MRCGLLLGVALVHRAAAVRSSDLALLPITTCTQAAPDPDHRWRFTLNHSQSQGVRHHSKYVLRLDPECEGPDLATSVSVIPQISSQDPLNNSSVVITVEPDDAHHRYFVCHAVDNESTCLAEVVLQRRAFRPRQLLRTLPLLKNSRRLLAVQLGESHPCLDGLEWAICLIALCFLATLIRALHLCTVTKNTRGQQDGPSDEQSAEHEHEGPGPITISNPLWESLDAWLQSLGFVVACVALVGGMMSILVSSNGPAWLIFFTVIWPATLGNLLLYLFWMSICRLQLFSCALARGICVRGRHPVNPRLILSGGCVWVLLLSVLATSLYSLRGDGTQAKDSENTGRTIALFVINPTVSLVSVFMYVYYRNLASYRTECAMSIEAMAQLMNQISTEEREATGEVHLPKDSAAAGTWLARRLRSGSVPVIKEGSFCQLCREGVDPVVILRSKDALPSGELFGFSDLAWQGRVVHQLSGYRVAMFNPPLALFFFLVLTTSSWCFGIMSMTTHPSLAGLEVSEYSLGKLYPNLRPWQTDYELVLDSFAHAFTFLETLSPDGAHKIVMGLPGRRKISTSERSEMVTVVSHRRSFPIHVNMTVMGILGRKTMYNMAVVTDYKLFTGLQVKPQRNGRNLLRRSSYAGEVDGSVFALPHGTTDVEITFQQELYSMEVPIGQEEAKRKKARTLTVFQPAVNSSIELCRFLCRNEARCMESRHSERGCFFIWGPATVPLSAFSFVADPVTDQNNCDHLGVRLCAREDGAAPFCQDMERGKRGVLRQTLPFKQGIEFRVRASTYSECKGLRKVVDDDMAELSFTRHFVVPTEILELVPGVETSLTTKMVPPLKKGVNWMGKQVVTVTLDKYVPPSPELVLRFAVLVSDLGPQIVTSRKSKSLCQSHDQNQWDHTSFWDEECKKHWKAAQYSVCGGWRPSRIVSCRLQAWAPWMEEKIWLVPPCQAYVCEMPTILVVRTKTEGDAHPAEWSLENENCSLDFRALEAAFADELLTPKVFITASALCPSVRILMANHTRNWSIVEFMKQALRRGPDMEERIGLLDSIAKSPFVEDKAAALQEVGFMMCDSGELCVEDETGLMELEVADIVWWLPRPWESGLIKFAFDLFSESDIQERVGVQALSSAMYVEKKEKKDLAGAISDYIKKRGKYIHLSSDDLNPSLIAIKQKSADLLTSILTVTTCCFEVHDEFMHQSLWELSIASGCHQCLKALKKRCGAVNRTELFFSTPSRADTWADLADVAKAFQKVPKLSSLGFVVVTQEAFRRTLVKLAWLARRGAFPRLQRLFFTAKEPVKLRVGAESARLLCDVLHAQPQLGRLLLVSEVDPSASAALIQCLRNSGHNEQGLELLNAPLEDDPEVLPMQITQMFQPPGCMPETNTTAVVSWQWLDLSR